MNVKRAKIDLQSAFDNLKDLDNDNNWKKITGDGLNLSYVKLLPSTIATHLLHELEDTVEYYDDELSKVSIRNN